MNKRSIFVSWLFVATLLALCGVLGLLQYRWIAEVSLAERERLLDNLRVNLRRLSRDFNAELSTFCAFLIPNRPVADLASSEQQITARWMHWSAAEHRDRIFRRVAIATETDAAVSLRMLDPTSGAFHDAPWPDAWRSIKMRMEARRSRAWPGPGGPPPGGPGEEDEGTSFALPIFGAGGQPFGALLLIEFDRGYLRDRILQDLVQRYLGAGDGRGFDVEIVERATPARAASQADAWVDLFAVRPEQFFHRPGAPARGFRELDRGGDFGRWRMYVRHRAGSLEAVVARARRRNLAVTASVLALIIASAAALIHFMRRSERLAELQMNFIAGVSHELRTPLTVIHTAAYNLRGGVASDPEQVRRYGDLIQRESGRLTEMVEEVLRFARAKSGRTLQERTPLALADIVSEALASIEGGGCSVETNIAPALPQVLGDRLAITHAVQNLLTNAVKYGAGESRWIGVFASLSSEDNRPVVELRVADRGPGIPEDERPHVFEPFFRGRQAAEHQIRGTGLGLSLVKEIVEDHGGTVTVRNGSGLGAEFVVHLPIAPAERQDEFAHTADRG